MENCIYKQFYALSRYTHYWLVFPMGQVEVVVLEAFQDKRVTFVKTTTSNTAIYLINTSHYWCSELMLYNYKHTHVGLYSM